MSDVEYKICSTCGTSKPNTSVFYPKEPRKQNGLKSQCKQCAYERAKKRNDNDEYRAKHAARAREKRANMTAEEYEAYKVKQREWKNKKYANDEEYREASKKRALDDRRGRRKDPAYRNAERERQKARLADEEVRARVRESARASSKRRMEDPERAAKIREYRRNRMRRIRQTVKGALNNRIAPAMARSLRKVGASKRRLKWESIMGVTAEELKNHLIGQFTEGMTWEKFVNGEIHVDHIKPIAAFNFSSAGHAEFKMCWDMFNLQPLWASDNLRKSAKLDWSPPAKSKNIEGDGSNDDES